jgi:ribonuclease E
MKRTMLINGQRPEELRVAVVADNRLENYLVDVAESGLCRGNIYRGVVAGVQPALNAAFVEFGEGRHGFLAAGDVVEPAYHRPPPADEPRPRIDQILERGKPVLGQVTKDATGRKGAALTTNVSLAGRYLVFTPFDDMRGLSRKVEDEKLRKAIKEKAKSLKIPEGAGYIIRTNAADQSKAALNRDLNALLRLWKQIQSAYRRGKGPKLLYSDQDLVTQVLRDYLDTSIQEVWVDSEPLLEQAQGFVKTFMPRSKVQLKAYTDRMPLFSRFGLESQIDAIFKRQVPLPGGGSIVIDPTEALTAIDVNSGKTKSGGSQEENILQVNLEAAAEVARQLRLRDIGGLIVVDFIDMRPAKNRRAVEKAVKDALKLDKARSSTTRISENGLMEINRQRLQQALQLRTHRDCPTCSGLGLIASPEHVALGLIRRVEARAAEGTLQGVRASLHPELADHIQNQHRREISDLEEEFDLRIEIIAASGLHRAEERIEWLRRDSTQPSPSGTERGRASRRGGASVTSFADLTETESDGASVVEPAAVGATATTPRRRRRSRRKKKHADGGEQPNDGGKKSNDGETMSRSDADRGPEERRDAAGQRRQGSQEPPSEGGGGSSRKRRRRPRRKKKANGGEAQRDSASGADRGAAEDRPRRKSEQAAGGSSTESAESSSGAGTRKRRRRPRRKKSADEG